MSTSSARDRKSGRVAELVAEIWTQATHGICRLEPFPLALPSPATADPALTGRVLIAANDLLDFVIRWRRAGGGGLSHTRPSELQAILRRFESGTPRLRSGFVSLNLLSLAVLGLLHPSTRPLTEASKSEFQKWFSTALERASAPTTATRPGRDTGSPERTPGTPISDTLLDAWLRYLEAIHAQQLLMQGLESASIEAFLSILQRLPQRRLAAAGSNLRSLHVIWIEASEAAYGRLLRRKAFPAAIGELVNAASALKLELDEPPPERGETIPDFPREGAMTWASAAGDHHPTAGAGSSGAHPNEERQLPESQQGGPTFSAAPDQSMDAASTTDLEFSALTKKLKKVLQALNLKTDCEVGWHRREPVCQVGKATLYRYVSTKRQVQAKPLLIVYALVNRPYMIDLEKDRSLIRGFLEAGLDIYLVDWGYPDQRERKLSLDDYVLDILDRCVKRVCGDSGQTRLNLLGICQGGVLALCYSALRPQHIGALVTMVTPTDFSPRNSMLARLVGKINVDQLVDAFGNVPGDLLSAMFLSLSPHRLGNQKYLRLLDLLDDEPAWSSFLRMERWIFDSPDQTGEAFRQFVREFIQKNGLIKGKVFIGGERVDLGRIEVPVLNIYAIRDHIVSANCAKSLGRYLGSRDYTEYAFPGGHIGIYVSRKAQREIPSRIATWLQTR